jgi:MFS family permease
MGPLSHAPRDLRLLAGAVFLSATGDIIAMITLALVVHDLTGSGLAVSALFATTLVPVIALAGVAGLVADRFESVRVLALASLAQAAVAGGLAVAATDLIPLLALSTLLAAGAAISNPAEFTLVPAVAAKGRLTEANGLIEAARYAGFAAGPLLAGAMAALGGSRLALVVNAVSFLAIAAAAGLMKTRRPPHRGVADETERARDGLTHLWRDRILRTTVLAATSALVFISASLTIDVFYVHEVLGAGASGYAAVYAAWMIGMVAGATRLAKRLPAQAMALGAMAALALQGAGVAGQTAWALLPVALAGSLVGGLGHGVKNTLMRVLIQQRVAERMQGRAFAAYGALRNAAELGALGLGGILVSAIGPRPALLIAGLGPVVAGLAGLAWLRGIRLNRSAAARLFFRNPEGGAAAAGSNHVGVRHLEPRAHEVLGVVDG